MDKYTKKNLIQIGFFVFPILGVFVYFFAVKPIISSYQSKARYGRLEEFAIEFAKEAKSASGEDKICYTKMEEVPGYLKSKLETGEQPFFKDGKYQYICSDNNGNTTENIYILINEKFEIQKLRIF